MESAEIEKLVGELETRVDRLRSLYEQYFMGIERMAPSVPHKDVERRIQVMRKEQIRNTAVRFRFQMIIQRYNTYQTHWQRVCRQIEEGTYKRDMLRAQRRFKPAEAEVPSDPPPPPPPEPEKPVAIPNEAPTRKVAIPQPLLELDDLDGAPAAAKPLPPRPMWRKVEKPPAPAAVAAPLPQAPAPPPLPKRDPPPLPAAAKPPPPPVPRSSADLSDDRLRQIYAQYVQTRRAQNESTAAITYDSMAKSLRESSAKLREKHGKTVDFEVAVKDGKTVLRPVVKPK